MLSGRWAPDAETRNIGRSQGYHGLSIRDQPVNCTVNGENTPAMHTVWHPTPRELDALMKGAPVVVRLLGTGHPPISVFVAESDVVPFYDHTLQILREALKPFARFFKSKRHDLSVADDSTIVAAFLDQETKEPLAELWIKQFRAAHEAFENSAEDRNHG